MLDCQLEIKWFLEINARKLFFLPYYHIKQLIFYTWSLNFCQLSKQTKENKRMFYFRVWQNFTINTSSPHRSRSFSHAMNLSYLKIICRFSQNTENAGNFEVLAKTLLTYSDSGIFQSSYMACIMHYQRNNHCNF